MRTNTLVGAEEVIANVLEELSFSCTKTKASIEAGRFGVHENIQRDFYSQQLYNTTTIMRGKTAIKWKWKLYRSDPAAAKE